MGFSGIGIWEILVILVVVLLVMGPNRLPEIARKMGQAVRTLRKASSDLTTTLTREVEAGENKPEQPKTAPAEPVLKDKIRVPEPPARKQPPATTRKPPEDSGEAPDG